MTVDLDALRDLARHQANILGEKVKDNLIWKAADEIETDRDRLEVAAVVIEANAKEISDLRIARAKLEGSGT